MDEVNAAYDMPSEEDLTVAKKHGFILQDVYESFEYSANGYNTKVRAWVKPDNYGFNTRNLICRDTPFKEGI